MNTVYGILMGFTIGIVTAASVNLLKRIRTKQFGIKNLNGRYTSAIGGSGTKMVFVVRTELGMGKGKIAAQCSHAALGCYKIAQQTTPNVLERWEDAGQPKIVLKLDKPGEEELNKLKQEAKKRGIASIIIHDAGNTQVKRGTATVAGFGPGDVGIIDQITGHLKLL